MVAYIGFLLFYSSFIANSWQILGKGIIIVICYTVFDLAWTFLRDKTFYLPVSSWISGFILSIASIPNPPLIILVALPLLAVASKQLLHFGKARHVFNPASFALAAVSLFIPVIGWWGVIGDGGPALFWIILLIGLFILWRQNRWHITITFLITYALLLSIYFILTGGNVNQITSYILPQIMDRTTLFFATVMVIEPLTTSFLNRRKEIYFAIITGSAVVLITFLGQKYHWGAQDPMVYGLLIGNLTASLLFLPAKPPAPTLNIK